MPGISDEKFDAILGMTKRAKTDNEKFAAMLIVTKTVEPENLPLEKLHRLLHCIGLQFPHRLLATACKSNEDQGVKQAYGSIAISVIKLFYLSGPEGFDLKSEKTAVLLLETLKEFSDFTDCDEIITDCLATLAILLERKTDIPYGDVFQALISCPYRWMEKVFAALTVLIESHPELTRATRYNKWIDKMSKDFRDEKGPIKFDICTILSRAIRCLNGELLPNSDDWLDSAIVGLGDILCSKVSQKHRQDAIILASEVISLVGLLSFIDISNEKNLVVVLTRLACIEIGLVFRDIREHRYQGPVDSESMLLIASCFKVTELFCQAIADFEQNEQQGRRDALNFEQIRLAQPTLSDMATGLIEYLSEAVQGDLDMERGAELHESSIRMFGAWMNIEYNVSSSQGLEGQKLLPILLLYIKDNKGFHLIKFIIPAIMLSSGSMDSSNDKVFSILCDISTEFVKSSNSYISGSDDALVLHLVLQCMVGMLTSEFKTNKSDAECCEFIDDIIEELHSQTVGLNTKAYLFTLFSRWLNRLPISGSSANEVFWECEDFVFEAFQVSKINHKLELNER